MAIKRGHSVRIGGRWFAVQHIVGERVFLGAYGDGVKPVMDPNRTWVIEVPEGMTITVDGAPLFNVDDFGDQSKRKVGRPETPKLVDGHVEPLGPEPEPGPDPEPPPPVVEEDEDDDPPPAVVQARAKVPDAWLEDE